MRGQPVDSVRQSRASTALSAATDFQRLVALGPSQSDWQTDLEAEAARLSSAPHVVAVTSANVALHCVLAASGLQSDDEVIIPAYLPPSIPEVIRQFNAHPIPVDIDAETAHIVVDQAADAITDRTRAIVTVDIAGLPVDTRPLKELCQHHRMLLVNDALTRTPGIGARYELDHSEVRINHCRSTETGLLSSGALISTSNQTLAESIRQQITPFDESAGDVEQCQATRSLHYADRMTGLAAVWHLVALGKARAAWRRRCQIAMSYTAAFSCRREYQVPFERPDASHAWLDYPLRLNLQHLGITRDEFTSELRRRGTAVTVPYLPINLMPRYQDRYGFGAGSFPVARNEFLRRVCLPIESQMTDADIDRMIGTLLTFADSLLERRKVTSRVG